MSNVSCRSISRPKSRRKLYENHDTKEKDAASQDCRNGHEIIATTGTTKDIKSLPEYAWKKIHKTFDKPVTRFNIMKDGESDGTDSDTGQRAITVYIRNAITGEIIEKHGAEMIHETNL